MNKVLNQCRNFSKIRVIHPSNRDYVKEIPISQYVKAPHYRNRVYVWGNIQTGALGVPYMKKNDNIQSIQYLQSPKRLHFGEKFDVTSASCGFGYTLLAVDSSDANKLYGTGLNTDSQIGYHEMRTGKPLEIIFFPQPVFLPFKNVETSKIIKVSSGRAHAAALTNEGLFLIGNNSYGQCGRMIVENEDYSTHNYINCIADINGSKITDVECGQDHTMVLTKDGNVYSCGWGADGQTGLGHFRSQSEFSKVGGDIQNERIIKLSCRSDFVLALNEKQEVFGWGNTEYSQINLPDNTQQLCNPTYIEMLKGLGKIKDISTGGSFCLILNENGDVFVWGFGILGSGPNLQQSKTPIHIPPQLFGFNDFNPHCTVEKISCGLGHMGAITNTGDLYMWGRNRSSCLGLGHKNDQYFPLKVALGSFVKNVHCGLDHTVAICKSYISDD